MSLINKDVKNCIINKSNMFERQNLLTCESQWKKKDDRVLGSGEVEVIWVNPSPL